MLTEGLPANMLSSNTASNSKKGNFTNLKAILLYTYSNYFLLVPERNITGIRCNLKINRDDQYYTEIDSNLKIPQNFIEKTYFSAFFGILKILNKNFLIFAEECEKLCSFSKKDVYEIKVAATVALENSYTYKEMEADEKLYDVTKKINDYLTFLRETILEIGYYFSYGYELTLSRQAFAKGSPIKNKFLWNLHIGKGLMQLEERTWFLGLIQGCIKCFVVHLQNKKIEYILISRRSWAKGGTRYNSRGVDIKGNVANFCETEQILFIDDLCYSHVLLRGSVPLFWKQTGYLVTVEMTSTPENNNKCFLSHFKKLNRNYGKILCLNLLSKTKNGEKELVEQYENYIKKHNLLDVKYEFFDMHDACRGELFDQCNYLIEKVAKINEFFHYYKENKNKIENFQNGVVRVNCLDNLDRTNLVQSRVAFNVLTNIFKDIGFDLNTVIGFPTILEAVSVESTNVFLLQLKNAWADNGDIISQHYTGTGSTHTNVTRSGTRNLMGYVEHKFKSAQRLYHQFSDNYKQEVIDLLLGEHTETVNIVEVESKLKNISETIPEETMSHSTYAKSNAEEIEL